MQTRIILPLLLVAIAMSTPLLEAEEIEGRILEVNNQTIKIATTSDLLPVAGDILQIFVEIPGVGKAAVGKAKISQVDGDEITATIEAATGRVAKDQLVTIQSDKPVKRPGIDVPLVVGQTAKAAKETLSAAGLTSRFQLGVAAPKGVAAHTVYAQEPGAGKALARGGTVVLKLYAAGDAAVTTRKPTARVPAGPRSSGVQDQATLEGRWICVESLYQGQRVDKFVGVEAIVKGRGLTWLYPRRDGTYQKQQCTFVIYPEQSPKWFDWSTDEEGASIHRRLYELAGDDELRWAVNDSVSDRPAAWESADWQFFSIRMKHEPAAEPIPISQLPAMGAAIAPVESEEARRAGIRRETGVLVTGTLPDGAAERAGLRAGDVIVSLDDEPVERPTELLSRIRARRVGDEIALMLDRDGQLSVVRLKTQARLTDELLLPLVRTAAEQGQAWAQNELGTRFETGRGVEQSDLEAARWFRLAADQGHVVAQASLGAFHEQGRGVERDYAAAFRSYQAAAEYGNAFAQRGLGRLYLDGKGTQQDDTLAVKWFRLAAEQGATDAQVNLGWMYQQGRGVQQDYATAVSWYRRAADNGNAYGQLNLGVAYENGWGVAKSPADAAAWYRRAAEQGLADAQVNLGLMYERGSGVERDLAAAADRYREAAEQGHARGQANLATMYFAGLGVEPDDELALDWYRQAAAQGDPHGQSGLGKMYELGRGVRSDYKEAMKWYLKSARQKHAAGQFNVGWLAYGGLGVRRSYETALSWFRLASQQNHADATTAIGVMYENGQGVSRDYALAKQHYERASQLGSGQAAHHLGMLYVNGNLGPRTVPTDTFAQSARLGYPDGHYRYAWALEQEFQNGTLGIPREDALRQIAEHYRKAADLGVDAAADALRRLERGNSTSTRNSSGSASRSSTSRSSTSRSSTSRSSTGRQQPQYTPRRRGLFRRP